MKEAKVKFFFLIRENEIIDIKVFYKDQINVR